jgi:hypothetical protein
MTDTTSPTTTTTTLEGQGLLRLALKLDAVVTAGVGAAYLALSGPLADLFGLPSGFLLAVGAFQVVYGLAVWAVGSRPTIDARVASAVVAGNAVWVAASILAVALGLHDPATAGSVWIAMQAATVALLADLQLLGIRRAGRS